MGVCTSICCYRSGAKQNNRESDVIDILANPRASRVSADEPYRRSRRSRVRHGKIREPPPEPSQLLRSIQELPNLSNYTDDCVSSEEPEEGEELLALAPQLVNELRRRQKGSHNVPPPTLVSWNALQKTEEDALREEARQRERERRHGKRRRDDSEDSKTITVANLPKSVDVKPRTLRPAPVPLSAWAVLPHSPRSALGAADTPLFSANAHQSATTSHNTVASILDNTLSFTCVPELDLAESPAPVATPTEATASTVADPTTVLPSTSVHASTIIPVVEVVPAVNAVANGLLANISTDHAEEYIDRVPLFPRTASTPTQERQDSDRARLETEGQSAAPVLAIPAVATAVATEVFASSSLCIPSAPTSPTSHRDDALASLTASLSATTTGVDLAGERVWRTGSGARSGGASWRLGVPLVPGAVAAAVLADDDECEELVRWALGAGSARSCVRADAEEAAVEPLTPCSAAAEEDEDIAAVLRAAGLFGGEAATEDGIADGLLGLLSPAAVDADGEADVSALSVELDMGLARVGAALADMQAEVQTLTANSLGERDATALVCGGSADGVAAHVLMPARANGRAETLTNTRDGAATGTVSVLSPRAGRSTARTVFFPLPGAADTAVSSPCALYGDAAADVDMDVDVDVLDALSDDDSDDGIACSTDGGARYDAGAMSLSALPDDDADSLAPLPPLPAFSFAHARGPSYACNFPSRVIENHDHVCVSVRLTAPAEPGLSPRVTVDIAVETRPESRLAPLSLHSPPSTPRLRAPDSLSSLASIPDTPSARPLSRTHAHTATFAFPSTPMRSAPSTSRAAMFSRRPVTPLHASAHSSATPSFYGPAVTQRLLEAVTPRHRTLQARTSALAPLHLATEEMVKPAQDSCPPTAPDAPATG